MRVEIVVPGCRLGAAIGVHPEDGRKPNRRRPMRYALLWLLGVPIPVLIVLYLIFH